MKAIDLTGQVFGRLTVVDKAPNPEHKQTRWNCLCECGNASVVNSGDLRTGNTRSCGCYKLDTLIERASTHSMSKTIIYGRWVNMRARCSNVSNKRYDDYGGRGISVCDRWRNSFQNFYDDMGDPPTPEHSIERQDNDKGYTPCNCYWADRLAQANNKRNNRLLTHLGRTQTSAQWSRELGISEQSIHSRLRYGWSVENTLTVGIRPRYRYLTHRDKTLTMQQWAKELGVAPNTLNTRLSRGWSIERTLSTPGKG